MTGYPYEFEFRRGERLESPADARSRMGMHDFSEHYGRYSGGPSYDYEYTERTIAHPYAATGAPHGFTRSLRRPRRPGGARARYGPEYGVREGGRARRGRGYSRSYRRGARGRGGRQPRRRAGGPAREGPGDWPRARPERWHPLYARYGRARRPSGAWYR